MKKKSTAIIKAGLIVGTLDIFAAFLYYAIRTGRKDVFSVLKYVASGLYGKAAFSGDAKMLVAGLLLHYSIAFAFTLFLFWLFSKTKVFSQNTLLTGILYGVFIWIAMNLVVVPLSSIDKRPFNTVNALVNMLILIFCIGIPLTVKANNFYTKNNALLVAA
jgi:uncharacterized membrane protein YagU involved in acid resistance